MSITKIVYLVDKRPELSDVEFIRHWTTVHAGLARTMPGSLELLDQLPVRAPAGSASARRLRGAQVREPR